MKMRRRALPADHQPHGVDTEEEGEEQDPGAREAEELASRPMK